MGRSEGDASSDNQRDLIPDMIICRSKTDFLFFEKEKSKSVDLLLPAPSETRQKRPFPRLNLAKLTISLPAERKKNVKDKTES